MTFSSDVPRAMKLNLAVEIMSRVVAKMLVKVRSNSLHRLFFFDNPRSCHFIRKNSNENTQCFGYY